MQHILEFIHIILHLNLYLGAFLNEYGLWVYALLFLIVFCETGLVITPFLPGDSLLFAVGTIMAASHRNVHVLIALLILASFCGDNTNYWIGRYIGPKVFNQHKKARFFKYEYFLLTKAFYEKHGGKAIIIARFLPLFRTFVPFVAGVSQMRYFRYIRLSFLSAIIWVCSITYLAYWFGNIPVVKNNFAIVILVIIAATVLPTAIGFLKHWHSKRKAKQKH